MEWTRGHTIGHGSSAMVSVAKVDRTGEVFAVKSTEFSQSKILQREQRILSQLSSPYVVKYIGSDVTTENGKVLYNILMEYVSGGTIRDSIGLSWADESMIRAFSCQILKGLDYLHSNGIVHCDIKGGNILIGENGAKIADFGCAKLVQNSSFMLNDVEDEKTSLIAGTPVFMAPEVARGEEQGYPADVWAFGCTVIEMASGCSPWSGAADAMSILYRIAYSDEVPEVPGCVSDQAKDFLGKCLKRNSKERWTVKELLKHPFLNESSSDLVLFQVGISNSPTSVLDQDYWNSTPELNCVGCPNSPAGRIQRLSRGGFCSTSNIPNWNWDEDWITVRSNNDRKGGAKELIITIAKDERESISEEIGMESSESCETDENVLNFYLDEISISRNRNDCSCDIRCWDFVYRYLSILGYM